MDCKIYLKSKETKRANTILKKKNIVERLTLFDFKNYCKPTLIKTVWYWKRKGTTNQ